MICVIAINLSENADKLSRVECEWMNQHADIDSITSHSI